MPRSCCAVNCTNRSSKICKMFSVPKGPHPFQQRRRKLWLQAIKRADWGSEGPKEGESLCSDHFISGAPSMNDEHPDFVPSIFFHSIEGSIGKLERYERKRKRGEEKTTVGSAMDVREDDGLDSLEAEEVFVPKERLDQLKLNTRDLVMTTKL
ncbi:hypothetical protein SKAU_G00413760 [Synaphobranchus kaupii]|uniref:THAP-type domain-containing protein n=1 Tax=Synaphobranchus kaupii TaxID=118154 RepID=A0A9Q1E8F6_SYNKA|nr:hypothetical protein SKAU_G00413760 [Synaphobranchus kaupii]